MKLLLPNENKDLREQENVRQIMRTQELEKAAKEARLKLADSQADFNTMLAQNRQKWALEEEEHQARIKQRNEELQRLEVQKLNMLVPFNILKEGVYADMSDAESFLSQLRIREENVEDLAERLQDKLDEVGSREQNFKQKELELNIREQGLENQSQSTVTGVKKLNADLADFLAFKNKTEQEIAVIQKIITIQEKHLER